jgi:hypothetical protein
VKRRSTFARSLIGTLVVFLGLLIFTFLLIYGEFLLENFKAH